MNILQMWYSRLRAMRVYIAGGFCGAIGMVMLAPTAWTPSERAAVRIGYWKGLAARLGDAILWRRALAGAFGVALFMSVFLPIVYCFSRWAHSFDKRRQ